MDIFKECEDGFRVLGIKSEVNLKCKDKFVDLRGMTVQLTTNARRYLGTWRFGINF